MKVTISVIKADIGSIGGHIRPSARLDGNGGRLRDRARREASSG